MTRTRTPNLIFANRLAAFLLLTASFTVTLLLSLAACRLLGRSFDSGPTQAELLQARSDAIAAIPQLAKDTEEKLAAALYPQLAPITATFSDPLVDRAGLDRNAQPDSVRVTSSVEQTLPSDPLVPEKLARLSQWQRAVRAATAGGLTPPSITTAYLISEVVPSGRVITRGIQAAWLYVESEKRQIAADVGAKFYDGVLISIDADGVVFRTTNGQTKIVQWENRQEEFSSQARSAATVRHEQNQPEQSRPQAVIQDLKRANAPWPFARPATPLAHDDYSDLQIAVRNRYPNAATVSGPTDTNNSSSKDRPEPLEKLTATELSPQVQQDRNPFSTVTTPIRANRLNYSHASYTRTAGPNIFATRRAHFFNFDDPNSFTAPADPSARQHLFGTETTSSVDEPNISEEPTETLDGSGRITEAEHLQQTSTTGAIPEAGLPLARTTESQNKSLCDPAYRGENITITNESNRPLSLLTLVNRLNEAYSANLVLDYDVQETPVRLTISNAPWTSILRTLLELNDLDMVCLDGGIVQIAKRSKIASMGDLRRRSAPIIREVFNLRYLQQTAGGRANLAGQTQTSTGANIQSLEDAIRGLLKAGGDPRGEARRVPGRNQLLVAATREQMVEIRDLIARVDRPGYQVKISALVYTANENRLRDIGSQLAIVVGNSQGTNLGGGATLADSASNNNGSGTGTGTGGANSQSVSGINPGGIPGLVTGMRVPTNALGAANPLATFGVTSLFGTAQFAYQLTLAQQKGAVNIQSRPFGIVADGDTFDLVAGTQIPVVTTTIAGGAPFQSGQVQFIEASRIARITPQVADDETGKPNYVTLNIQLENNSVDTSLGTFNGVPGVNRQSLQTVLRLRNGETVVIGGLAADQVSNSVSKVPGLSGIPILGNLFKRRADQENRDRLYFAITVEVIPQDSAMPNFQAPADAITTPPPPPRVQKPSPYDKRQ